MKKLLRAIGGYLRGTDRWLWLFCIGLSVCSVVMLCGIWKAGISSDLADDGSGDGTVALAESYRERMEQRGIRFVILRGGHRNASHALRAGLALVTGEYLIWPDADDILEKDSVRARVAFLDQHPDVQCVRSLAYYFNPETGERAAADEKRGDLKQERLFWDVLESRTFVCCGCYMLRSEAFFAIYPGGKIPVSFVGQNFQMLLPFLYRHACPTIGRELYGVAVRASRKRAGNGRRNHMRLFERKEECCGCGACEAVCAARAIVMRQDEEGFFYPQADETRCTGCGACLRVCPLKREKREEKKAPARGSAPGRFRRTCGREARPEASFRFWPTGCWSGRGPSPPRNLGEIRPFPGPQVRRENPGL